MFLPVHTYVAAHGRADAVREGSEPRAAGDGEHVPRIEVVAEIEELYLQLDVLSQNGERLVHHQVEGEERGERSAVWRPDVGAARVDDGIREARMPFDSRGEAEVRREVDGAPGQDTVGGVGRRPRLGSRLQDLDIPGRKERGKVVDLPKRRGARSRHGGRSGFRSDIHARPRRE